jgi:hypothetical protein
MERRVETKNGSAYGVRPTWKVSSSQLALGHFSKQRSSGLPRENHSVSPMSWWLLVSRQLVLDDCNLAVLYPYFYYGVEHSSIPNVIQDRSEKFPLQARNDVRYHDDESGMNRNPGI